MNSCSFDEESVASTSHHLDDDSTMKRRSFSCDDYNNTEDSRRRRCCTYEDYDVHISTPLHQKITSSRGTYSSSPSQLRRKKMALTQSSAKTTSSSLFYTPENNQHQRQQRCSNNNIDVGGLLNNNLGRANTCPQHYHEFLHHHQTEDLTTQQINHCVVAQHDLLSTVFSGEDDEELADHHRGGDDGGGFQRVVEIRSQIHGANNIAPHPSSLQSSSTIEQNHPISSVPLLPSSTGTVDPSPSRRRAASTPSISIPPSSPSHSGRRTRSSSSSTSSILPTATATASSTVTSILPSTSTIHTIKHTFIKLLMLLSIIQVLSYTYNKGISPDIKYKLGEINYDIEEYWYGGRLWSTKTSTSSSSSLGSSLSGSNKLLASRIVGSSGISFTDDNVVVVDEDGEEEDDEGGVVGFITSLLNGRFGDQDEGGVEGVDEDEDKDEGENQEQVAVVAENNVKSEKDDVTSSNVGVDPTQKTENSPEILNPIFATTTNNDNIKTTMKRRPAMAHVISISDSRHPAHHLPRSSSSRRMKHNVDHHRNKWTLSRIVGTIIWIGLMIPILEVVIRELSRRYRLGSLLRRTRIRLTRGFLLRRGLAGGENVHNL